MSSALAGSRSGVSARGGRGLRGDLGGGFRFELVELLYLVRVAAPAAATAAAAAASFGSELREKVLGTTTLVAFPPAGLCGQSPGTSGSGVGSKKYGILRLAVALNGAMQRRDIMCFRGEGRAGHE